MAYTEYFKHDVIRETLDETSELIIAADNSGAIGEKEADAVHVSYDVMSYYTFRVTYMELVAAGGHPSSIIMHNFNAEDAWEGLLKGIRKGQEEVGLSNLKVSGSTETNFSLSQSALGFVMIGRREKPAAKPLAKELNLSIIGYPLVGNDVLLYSEKVAPLRLFKEISELEGVVLLRPVSSKGIAYEINRQFGQHEVSYPDTIDPYGSGGPATSFIVVYDIKIREKIEELAKDYLAMTSRI